MRALSDIAADNDIYLHADEVYKGSELEGPETASFLDLYDKAFVTNGLSKAMALPGLRIGWLAGLQKQFTQHGNARTTRRLQRPPSANMLPNGCYGRNSGRKYWIAAKRYCAGTCRYYPTG